MRTFDHNFFNYESYWPDIDDRVLPAQITELMETDKIINVRKQQTMFMIGFNSGEGSLKMGECEKILPKMSKMDDFYQFFKDQLITNFYQTQAVDPLANSFESNSAPVIPSEEEIRIIFLHYFPFLSEKSEEKDLSQKYGYFNEITEEITDITAYKEAACRFYGDIRVIAPIISSANFLADQDIPVFTYYYNYLYDKNIRSPSLDWVHSAHAEELYLTMGCVFTNNCNYGAKQNVSFSKDDKEMSENIMNSFAAFVEADTAVALSQRNYQLEVENVSGWKRYFYNGCDTTADNLLGLLGFKKEKIYHSTKNIA